MLGIDKEREFKSVNIAVVTISDTRTLEEDKSGDTLEKRIIKAGHNITGRFLVKDDVVQIKAKLNDLISNEDVDVIIATGGTGITGRDLTPEVFSEILEINRIKAIVLSKRSLTIILRWTYQVFQKQKNNNRYYANIENRIVLFIPKTSKRCIRIKCKEIGCL